MSFTIIILDPFPLIRLGLIQTVGKEFDSCYIQELSSWDQFCENPMRIIPEVFIFGIELNPPNKSIATIRKIRKKFPGTDIIVYDGKRRVSKLAAGQYLKVGASAYLSKSAPVHQLIEYIKMFEKKSFKPEGRFGVLVSSSKAAFLKDRYALSEEEVTIANYLSQGYRTYYVAKMLGLPKSELEPLKKQILSKFGVTSIRRLTEMMKWSPE